MRYFFSLIIVLCGLLAHAQEQVEMPIFNAKHGLQTKMFRLNIRPSVAGRTVRFTLDGSAPTLKSQKYVTSFNISQTTIVRAAEVIGDTALSDVATASYIFPEDILTQGNDSGGNPACPQGYPSTWGAFVQITGTAPAYYAMDSHIVSENKAEILHGFQQLPIVSIATAPGNLFSHEVDSITGGIYIHTGAPVGSGVGRDWTRPVSLELFGGPMAHDLTVDCALKLHGGHSRLPEKTPKHAFRLQFKGKYGASKLHYPVFGEEGAEKYESLVLRTFFGNSWVHHDETNRQRGQYTRDLWARATQQRMNMPHSKGQAVHLFLNGLYWGIYNLCERLDAEHCAYNYGGKKSQYDVIKVEETESEKIVAADGTLDAWNEMRSTTEKISSTNTAALYRLEGRNESGVRDTSIHPLLDIDNLMDYMLINFYAGNTDWDSHNWLAFRPREGEAQGFRFFCWDTEMIFGSSSEDVTGKNTSAKPSHLLQCILRNPLGRQRFNHRIHLAMKSGGILSPEGVVEVWDSLYHGIDHAIYDECARWGDYRRDIHPYTQQGHRYRINTYFMNERNRLLTQYFPVRTQKVLNQLEARGWYTPDTDDYEEYTWDALPSITPAAVAPIFVYDLQGRCVGRLTDEGQLPSTLPQGLYIARGKKLLKN